VRSTFRDSEIECYRVILANPGLTRKQIAEKTYFAEDTVRNALVRLYEVGAIDRDRSEPDPNRPGYAPFVYRALRGTEPFLLQQKSNADRYRLRQALDGRLPTARGLRRNRAKGWLMSKAEWETLFINYELLNPGEGDLIIYEHIDSRRARGEAVELGFGDIPRLMAEVERRRREGRRRLAAPGEGLSEATVREARERHAAGEPISALARDYGVTWDAMSKAVKGRSWKRVA